MIIQKNIPYLAVLDAPPSGTGVEIEDAAGEPPSPKEMLEKHTTSHTRKKKSKLV